jgi:tRNA modification GTPase
MRNKIDLVDQVDSDRSEVLEDVRSRSESRSQINQSKSLKYMINSSLANKSESNHQTNSSLTKMVNQGLTGKCDLIFNISATTGAGIDLLIHELHQYVETMIAGSEQLLVSRARHRVALEQTLAALNRAEGQAGAEDLLAEELRTAAHALGRLTGRVDVEDVLDVIFRDFCIGK